MPIALIFHFVILLHIAVPLFCRHKRSNFPEIKEANLFYVIRKLVRCDRQKFMKRKSSGSWHLIKRLGLLDTRNFQRLEIILELEEILNVEILSVSDKFHPKHWKFHLVSFLLFENRCHFRVFKFSK